MKLGVVVVAAVVGASSLAFAQGKHPPPIKVVSPVIAPPPLDVGTPITVPAAPAFELVVPSNGNHSVQELLVNGRKLLGTQISVEGTVTWIYECVDAVRKKGQSKAQAQKMIDADPTICERKKLYLGDDRGTPPERSLWIVDVPRPPNKMERERLPKDEIKNWPKVPKIAVGDRVVVTGQFALSSPHSERNSDGLLVFASIAPAPKGAPTPTRVAPPDPPATSPLIRRRTDRPPISVAASNNSIRLAAEATKLYGNRQYDDAIAKYKAALTSWSGHHFAWYGMAGCYIGKNDWVHAVDAIDNAVYLAPDQPMYLMVYGVAIYESIMAREREAQARRENRDPSQVTVDVSTVDFSKALPPLVRAVQIEPTLWRAQYYIGRIHRDAGFGAAAATAFREAIAGGASTAAPFIALVELYRRWGFAKEASDIALLGTARFQGPASADLWYVLGMSYFDQHEQKLAIQSFTQALAADPAYAKALFQRGQSQFALKDKKAAKADLEAFIKLAGGDGSLSFALQQANKMLMDLGSR